MLTPAHPYTIRILSGYHPATIRLPSGLHHAFIRLPSGTECPQDTDLLVTPYIGAKRRCAGTATVTRKKMSDRTSIYNSGRENINHYNTAQQKTTIHKKQPSQKISPHSVNPCPTGHATIITPPPPHISAALRCTGLRRNRCPDGHPIPGWQMASCEAAV